MRFASTTEPCQQKRLVISTNLVRSALGESVILRRLDNEKYEVRLEHQPFRASALAGLSELERKNVFNHRFLAVVIDKTTNSVLEFHSSSSLKTARLKFTAYAMRYLNLDLQGIYDRCWDWRDLSKRRWIFK